MAVPGAEAVAAHAAFGSRTPVTSGTSTFVDNMVPSALTTDSDLGSHVCCADLSIIELEFWLHVDIMLQKEPPPKAGKEIRESTIESLSAESPNQLRTHNIHVRWLTAMLVRNMNKI